MEHHAGYRYLHTRFTQAKTEVHVAGPDRVERPFMRALRKEARSRGAHPVELVYQIALIGSSNDELDLALAEVLSAQPEYGLRSVRVADGVVHVSLDGPGNPPPELIAELKRIARTRLRKPVGLILKTHLTTVLTAPP